MKHAPKLPITAAVLAVTLAVGAAPVAAVVIGWRMLPSACATVVSAYPAGVGTAGCSAVVVSSRIALTLHVAYRYLAPRMWDTGPGLGVAPHRPVAASPHDDDGFRPYEQGQPTRLAASRTSR